MLSGRKSESKATYGIINAHGILKNKAEQQNKIPVLVR